MQRILVVTLLGALVLTACGEGSSEGGSSSSVATTTTETATTTTEAATTTTETATTTTEAATTTTEAATTSTALSDEQLAAAAAIGDIAAGEELFNMPLSEMRDSVSCSSCHSLDGPDTQWGPTLAGISAVAADRIDGMLDVDYLRQSIVDPYAFVVGGEWAFAMPYKYPDVLSEEQINNLIAFLLTR